MIKRRSYKQDHADKDEASDSSSSSSSSSSGSESEAEPQAEQEQEEETPPEAEAEAEAVEVLQAPETNEDETKLASSSSGSGYESEDSSEKELEYDSSGNVETEIQSYNRGKKYSTEADYSGRILKCKSVYKCRLCPRIVLLTEESLKAHLNSKRHARSEKLLSEGRLKFMLNSDGEIEEDQETHAERHARTVALAQDSTDKKKKNKGRQRQKFRLKRKKMGDDPDKAIAKAPPAKKPTKKRHKTED